MKDVVEDGYAFTPVRMMDLAMEEGALLLPFHASSAVLEIIGLRVEER